MKQATSNANVQTKRNSDDGTLMTNKERLEHEIRESLDRSTAFVKESAEKFRALIKSKRKSM